MKFQIRDLSDIPELGVKALIDAAKTLPFGKGIEVAKGELPYNHTLVLANLVKGTGFKFIVHETTRGYVFEKVDGRGKNQPAFRPQKSSASTPEARVKFLARREDLWYLPLSQVFKAMRGEGLYAATTMLSDAEAGLKKAILAARGKLRLESPEVKNGLRDAKAKELGYYQVKGLNELKAGRGGYVGAFIPLVNKYKTVAVAFSLFGGDDNKRHGFSAALRNAGFNVVKVKRGRGKSYEVKAGESIKSSYYETENGRKELEYARKAIVGREEQFKEAYPAMTGAELKAKFNLTDASWSSKIARALGLATKGIGWKKPTQNGVLSVA